MLHLLKLEMKKCNLGWYVKGAMIANIMITAVVCCVIFIAQKEGDMPISTYEDVNVLIGASVRATFIVFASVLMAKLVVEEYKNRTILLMFTYPVSRKKLIASKLTLIAFLTFLTTMISNIVVAGIIPLYFGMRNYSVPATIGSSLLVVAIACAYNPEISLVTFIPLQLGLGAVGVIIAYLGIRNIENVDVV